MMPIRRRRYIISRLQVYLLLTIASYGLLAVLAVAGLVFLPVALDMGNSELPDAQRAKAGAVFLAMDVRLWPAIAAIIVAISSHAILMTHRLVGPLYRLCQVMGAAARGDYTVLARIRKKDLLHAEADALNELLRNVDRRWKTVRKDARQLRDVLDGSFDRAHAADPDGTLRELCECLERLEGHLGESERVSPARVDGDAPAVPPSALPAAQSSSRAEARGSAP